jgi:hypothetical protein
MFPEIDCPSCGIAYRACEPDSPDGRCWHCAHPAGDISTSTAGGTSTTRVLTILNGRDSDWRGELADLLAT